MSDREKVAENLAEYLETSIRNRVISESFSEVIISLTKAEEIFALLKEQEEQIKNRDESLEKAREEIKWLRGMLKEQEARVVTTADLENNPNLDDSNHLNVWEEYRDGTRCGWNTININDVITFTDIRRYWTSRPTEEQKKAVKWDE